MTCWMRFRQFLLRGLESVTGEWSLVTMAWNIRRMAVLRGIGNEQDALFPSCTCDADKHHAPSNGDPSAQHPLQDLWVQTKSDGLLGSFFI